MVKILNVVGARPNLWKRSDAVASGEIAKVFVPGSSRRCSTPGRAWGAVRRCAAKIGKRAWTKFANA